MSSASRFASVVLVMFSATSCVEEAVPGAHCNSDVECTSAPYTQCNTAHHACRIPGSGVDGDMGAGDDMTMIACTSSATCPASAPVCGAQQQCASCGTVGMSTECSMYHAPASLCGAGGACVECNTKDNCDADHKTCDLTSHTCGPCKTNEDCTSGVCNNATGVCADKGTLLYVNNAGTAGCSDGGTGAFATPFCTVQRGINASAATGKQVIIFAGQGYSESLQANGTADYFATALGVGGPVIKPPAAQPALSVAGNGASSKTVSLTFDGVVLDGTSLTGSVELVNCTGGGAAYGKALVKIVRSTLKGAPGYGVNASAQCTITLDADLIRDNKGGAVLLSSCDFALTNLLILSNGTATNGGTAGSNFGGINVAAAGELTKMTAANLTLVGNKADTNASASAMLCPVAAVKTINTVVFGNAGPTTEVQAACIGTAVMPQMTYSAYAGGSAMLNNEDLAGCVPTTLFVDSTKGDFTPKKGSAAPCNLVDQGTTTGAPDHDYAGVSRPQPLGGKDDIGALEAP